MSPQIVTAPHWEPGSEFVHMQRKQHRQRKADKLWRTGEEIVGTRGVSLLGLVWASGPRDVLARLGL